MLDDPPSQHIVKAIVALCDALRLGVIAEGIEQEEQASLLMELGCTEGQGFLFGAAIDAASAWELVAAPEDALSNT
jgi:EAL domain-containing protein (putative c-di-GMP-specific phosphodiesterase class I)